jgi:hypothetical protein
MLRRDLRARTRAASMQHSSPQRLRLTRPRTALVGALVAVGMAASAQASAASWHQDLNLPTFVAGATAWTMTAESCTSANHCLAVGTTLGPGPNGLLAEIDEGSGWAVEAPPQTVGYQPSLNAIDCVSAKFCMTVGQDYTGVAANTVALAEIWNGLNWKVVKTPDPAGSRLTQLNDVVCRSAKSCIAVGQSANSKTKVLAESWNGSKWRITKTPDPAGATNAQLNGLDCPTTTDCIAVGYWDNQPTAYSTLAEVWNGNRWRIEHTANPSKFSQLNDISCPLLTECEAVGNGIAERWNGKAWKAQRVSRAPQSTSGGPDLARVFCPDKQVCTAVGAYYRQGVLNDVAARWDGRRWTTQVPPISTSSDLSVLSDVWCASPKACTAVGSYQDPVNGYRALVEDYTG